ncbi:MAG: YHYH domain-containing protein, partial [Alphaproteobacteria bacterium]
MRVVSVTLACALIVAPVAVAAHPGGLNGEGCHNNRKTGAYHCHRAGGGSRGGGSSAP